MTTLYDYEALQKEKEKFERHLNNILKIHAYDVYDEVSWNLLHCYLIAEKLIIDEKHLPLSISDLYIIQQLIGEENWYDTHK